MTKDGYKVVTPRKDTFTCQACHRVLPVRKSGGTGYATTGSGKRICYECAGKRETKEISKKPTGSKHIFYLTKHDGKYVVSNWPGTIKYPVYASKTGSHNIAGSRIDVWFKDHDGQNWHGVQMGGWNEILHAKKVKN